MEAFRVFSPVDAKQIPVEQHTVQLITLAEHFVGLVSKEAALQEWIHFHFIVLSPRYESYNMQEFMMSYVHDAVYISPDGLAPHVKNIKKRLAVTAS